MKHVRHPFINLTSLAVILFTSQNAFANLSIALENNLVNILHLEIINQPHGNFWIDGQKWENQARFTIDQTDTLNISLTTTSDSTLGEGTLIFFNEKTPTKEASSCTFKFQYCSVAGNCDFDNNSKISMLEDSNGLCERTFIVGEGDASITLAVDE